MDFIESVAWVALGFIPTFVALEVAWRITKRKLIPVEVVLER